MEGGEDSPGATGIAIGGEGPDDSTIEATSADAFVPPSRVYVGNLSWEATGQDLKDLFVENGLEVVKANVMLTPDGRSKGCGIVELSSTEDAQKAISTLNDLELMGRQIFVREDRETRGGGGAGHRFSAGEQSQSRRVYVGNLSWDVAWQDLKDHMRQAGEVVHAEVISEHNGRSKGCGIVEFSTQAEAQEAITTLTDSELKGRMIFVREDREGSSGGAPDFGSGRSPSTSLYVWNLSYETTWQELKDHMRKAGNVDTATILTDAEGNSIGCGVVIYQRAQEAARAIRELQESELNGRVMRLREDRGAASRGGRGGGRFGGRGRGRGRGRGGRGGGRFGSGRGHYGGRGGGGADGRQLYVGNLAHETNWRDLKDHFRQCGDVERSDIRFSSDAHSPNFGIIRYYESSDAENAIATLNGVELHGSALEVRLDQRA